MSFYRNSDQSGVPNTCPLIDEVITILESIQRSNDPMNADQMIKLDDTMEEIRRANAALREYGQDQARLVYEKEKEIDDLNKDLARKDDIIADLRYDLDQPTSLENSLSNEIDELKAKIDDLTEQINAI